MKPNMITAPYKHHLATFCDPAGDIVQWIECLPLTQQDPGSKLDNMVNIT